MQQKYTEIVEAHIKEQKMMMENIKEIIKDIAYYDEIIAKNVKIVDGNIIQALKHTLKMIDDHKAVVRTLEQSQSILEVKEKELQRVIRENQAECANKLDQLQQVSLLLGIECSSLSRSTRTAPQTSLWAKWLVSEIAS